MGDSINLILDTDIGPDCDDAGALALLHILSKRKNITIHAITNCTSNSYAAGTIDAINLWYGQKNIPVGTFEKDGFLSDEDTQTYNKYITLNYKNRYIPPVKAPGALEVLKKALRNTSDHSITLVAIGPLNNIAGLLSDNEGFELVKQKIVNMVYMGPAFDPCTVGWNNAMDIVSAVKVFDLWPTPVVISPSETGTPIITGRDFGSLPADHPVRLAYRLWNQGDDKKGRSSWDLTAIWYAIMGAEPFFYLSETFDVKIGAKGEAIKTAVPGGRYRFLLNKMEPEKIAQDIDALWE
jgi:hypothetical protein